MRRAVPTAIWAPAFLALAVGCAHEISIEPPVPTSGAASERIPVALRVDSVEDYRGPYWDLGTGFVNWVVMELRRTRSFTAVLGPEDASPVPPDAVHLRLVMREAYAQHWGPNVARAIAVGVSLLTLAPIMSFETGYEVELEGHLETCDHWTQELVSRATGELRYKVFLTDRRRGWRVLTSGVVERALEGMRNQIVDDERLRARVTSLAATGHCARSVAP